MKLFKIKNNVDSVGVGYATEYMFSTGLCFKDSKKFDGLYFLFRSPRKFKTNYVSSETFETVYGVCRNSYLFMIRKPSRKYYCFCTKVTGPTN